MSKKRVVVISDLHCGHAVGLTHPDFNPGFRSGPKAALSRERARYWKYYAKTVEALQPIDFLVVNGDAIDGAGEASGGTEQLTTDRDEQVKMAIAAIKICNAQKISIIFGTGYHTGKAEDFENNVAIGVSAIKIGGEDFFDVNGLTFSFKHHVGRSESPMGRFTALARDRTWNVLWSENKEYPKAHVIVRSHVHYYAHCGSYGWDAFSTPALQGYGSKFGTRRMSGTVDFGLLSFDVMDKEHYTATPFILKENTQRSKLIVI